jgi:hypothetical protein
MDKKKIMDTLANVGIRAAGVSVGVIAGSAIDKIAFIGNLSPYIRGAGKIIIGAILPEIHNKPNDKASLGLASFGAGFTAAGALDIAKTALPAIVSGVVSGDILSGLTVDTDYKVAGDEEKVSGGDNIVGII